MLLTESPGDMNEVRARPEAAASSYRSSRRFACDRCRAYKARCERNGDLGVSCERCLKARHECTTNLDQVPPPMSFAIQQQQQQHWHHWRNGSGDGNNSARDSRSEIVVAQQPSPVTDQSARVPFNSPQMATARIPRQLYGTDDTDFSRAISRSESLFSSAETPNIYITSDSSSRPLSSSQSTSAQALVSNEPPNFDDNTTSSSSNNNHSLDSNYTGDLDEMNYSMDFSMPHLVFDKVDFAGLSDHHSTSRNSAAPIRPAAPDDSSVMRRDADRVNNQARQNLAVKLHNPPRPEPEPTNTSAASAANNESRLLAKNHKELLKLNLELMEDEEMLEIHKSSTTRDGQRDTQAVLAAEDSLISRVLRRTSRFWEILSSISVLPEARSRMPSDGGFASDGDRASRHLSWQRRAPNTLIIVHLITTYVSLIRISRSVFQHLYHVFQVIPPDQVGTVLNLPSLQLGEFQMENNLTIQVQALIELSSGMLLRIEEALGVSTASGPGLNGEGASAKTLESHQCRNSIMSDPVAVSLREIILSQERLHNAANEVGSPSLQVVMNNLKRLLQRR